MVELAKDSIDLGIIVEDPETALKFYRDTLGFEYDAIGPMDMGDGTVMHRLLCGTSLIKVREVTPPPPNKSAPGGINASTGNRYCPSQAPPLTHSLSLFYKPLTQRRGGRDHHRLKSRRDGQAVRRRGLHHPHGAR